MQKKTKNGLPPFPPILSATGTPTYELGKSFPPFLTPLTKNEYTAEDLFDETIDLCVDSLYDNNEKISKKDVFFVICLT